MSDLQSNMLTISMNINFNKIVETSNLQQSYTQYLYSIQIVKNYSKPGAPLVNTISSGKCTAAVFSRAVDWADLSLVHSRPWRGQM